MISVLIQAVKSDRRAGRSVVGSGLGHLPQVGMSDSLQVTFSLLNMRIGVFTGRGIT